MKIIPGLNPRIPGIPGLGDGEIEDVVNLPPICKDNVLSKKFNILFKSIMFPIIHFVTRQT